MINTGMDIGIDRLTGLSMKTSLQQVLQAEQIDDLKRLGTFIDVKKCIEAQLMLKLGVNGWMALCSKLEALRAALRANNASVQLAAREKTFKDARRRLSESLGFKITAKNQTELDRVIQTCSMYRFNHATDPHKRFEQNKRRNFINSSKLEGIHLHFTDEETSLEMILAKHRR
ncbi:Uncharacterized protein ALO80_04189 [Pseudomonas caricapapayae]|uniref:Uncharacterized protein n=2 Tax=Pseudomonas caricapapayae TaxID=46678 RepID=A0A0P9KJQ7_9PSED|nr:Uncharacterized protein ALO80_04189 [Pseudomonas caricapapayae]RMM11011.1 hypothetical protein ALQ84_02843 [Pseudomonas caricapapayae]RMV91858.1 hypothetical protein ALP01_100495 [Pseudomonas caricapapayae]